MGLKYLVFDINRANLLESPQVYRMAAIAAKLSLSHRRIMDVTKRYCKHIVAIL